MVHTSIRISANGDTVLQGIPSEDIAAHIAYNVNHRFGQLLMVDGHIIHFGYISLLRASEYSDQWKDHRVSKATTPPYQ